MKTDLEGIDLHYGTPLRAVREPAGSGSGLAADGARRRPQPVDRVISAQPQPVARVASAPLQTSKLVAARARIATLPTWLVALLAVVVADGLVLISGAQDMTWLAGVAVGVGAGASVALGRRRFGGRARAAACAELRTRAALKPLERSGWRLLHDIAGPEGPLDHIAVGHGGVILLQSMAPDGVVTMHAGEPVVQRGRDAQGEPQIERLRPRALADATIVKEAVERLTGRRMWVQSVVVFWSEFPAGCVVDGRSVFIHGSRLAEWLTRRPRQLDEIQVDEVFADVEVLAQAGADLPLRLAV